MENVRNRMRMELVSDERKCNKLINQTSFRNITIYNNHLAAIHLDMDVLKFNKPIYVDFSILDISKTLMYNFHYTSMKQHFGNNIELMYMDTGNILYINMFIFPIFIIKIISDSLVYSINTKDFYADLKNNQFLFQRMDTSNFPTNHSCYCVDRKKIPGTFTDETCSEAIHEFIALRAKSYAYNLAGIEHIKSKGIRRHVIKNHMTIEP